MRRRVGPLGASSLAIAGACIALASLARAEDTHRVRLEVTGEACQEQGSFERELRGRLHGDLRAPSPGEAARSITVRIDSNGTKIVGRLTVRELDGTETRRTVEGESCASVSSGLALVAALAIDETPEANATRDGGAKRGEAGESSVKPAATTGGATNGATNSEGADGGTNTSTATKEETKIVDAGVTEDDAGARVFDGPRPHVEIAVGVGGGVFLGAAPRPSPLVAPFLEVAYVGARGSALAARARVSRGGAGPSGTPAAAFTWTTGSLDLCPIGAPIDSLRLSLCGRFEAGALDAQGRGVTPAVDEQRAWVALGAVGRARWILAKPVFLEAEAVLEAPLVRDRFYVLPDETLFRAPPVAGGGALGVGAFF